jgi:hypothetical protein
MYDKQGIKCACVCFVCLIPELNWTNNGFKIGNRYHALYVQYGGKWIIWAKLMSKFHLLSKCALTELSPLIKKTCNSYTFFVVLISSAYNLYYSILHCFL